MQVSERLMEDGLKAHLDAMGIGDLYEAFARNDIDLSMLPDLVDADLREMGLTLGQRKRVKAALEKADTGAWAAPELQPERRQLTVLFCDLVGSTALAAVLDPEDLRDLMAAYHHTCATIMRQHGGHVAYLQGDGLMVYFGYPFAREDDPERAIRAALETSKAVAGLDTPAPEPLRVRIGMATGLVVVGDLADSGEAREEMVVGETPNLASRLTDLAAPGQVIVPESTRRIAGALFDYERLGAFGLKGFPDPVTAYRVLAESSMESRFEARASAGLSPIIGRDAELATLEAMWREAVAGAGRLVTVRGEAGIGKSRLARAFTERRRQERATVLKWYCASHLANRPLHPIVREIERTAGLPRESSPARRRERLDAAVAATPGLTKDDMPLMAELLGLGDEAARALDPVTRSRRITDALLRRAIALTDHAPLLLVMEDAHWADTATQEFIALLMEKLSGRSALLVVTHRPDFVPPWAIAGRGRAVALDRLDASAGAQLISMTVRDRILPDTVMRSILEKADGVPLFVEELTKTVLEAVLDSGTIDAAFATLAVPTTLQDSLMARLDRLGPAKEVAQLGAVIGREFTADMIRVIAPPRCDVDGGLAQLQSADLVVRGGHGGPDGWVFRHALVQDTAYESLLKKRRRDVHAMIATAMQNGEAAFMGTEPEVIARHCAKALMHEAAADHWLAAGRDALDRAAAQPALIYLGAAIESAAKLPESERRARCELEAHNGLAMASMAVHGWASHEVEQACRRAGDLAAQLGESEALFGALWGRWTTLFLRGQLDDGLAVAMEVDAMARAADLPLLLGAADHGVGYTQFFRGELQPALERAEAGIARFDGALDEICARTFQFSSRIAMLSYRACALWMLGRVDETGADAALDEALEAAERLGHRPSLAYAFGAAGQTLVMRKRWHRLREVALRCKTIANEEGFRLWSTVADVHLALARGFLENPADGLAEVDAGRRAFLATQSRLTDTLQQAAVSELMLEVGDLEAARDRLKTVIDDAEKRAERLYFPELRRVQAKILTRLGEADAAAEALRLGHGLASEQGAAALMRDIDSNGPSLALRVNSR
jgi:class 3 adenylate cyclase